MSNSKYSQLKNPPITEAIFEVLFNLNEDFDVLELNKFHANNSKLFTRKDEIFQHETKIGGKGVEHSSSSELVGYLLLTEDRTKAIQIRKDGYAYSITKNSYTNWDSFKSEALDFLNQLIEMFAIKGVTRTSLRYINSINLPGNLTDIKDYILIAPDMPPKLSYGINQMFMQMVIPNEKIGGTAIITQNFNVGNELKETFPFIIDINVHITKFRKLEIKSIVSDFDKLRDFKNEIFFESITDKTKEIITQ